MVTTLIDEGERIPFARPLAIKTSSGVRRKRPVVPLAGTRDGMASVEVAKPSRWKNAIERHTVVQPGITVGLITRARCIFRQTSFRGSIVVVEAKALGRVIKAVARAVEGSDRRPSAVIKTALTALIGSLGAADTDASLLIAGAVPPKSARRAVSGQSRPVRTATATSMPHIPAKTFAPRPMRPET